MNKLMTYMQGCYKENDIPKLLVKMGLDLKKKKILSYKVLPTLDTVHLHKENKTLYRLYCRAFTEMK